MVAFQRFWRPAWRDLPRSQQLDTVRTATPPRLPSTEDLLKSHPVRWPTWFLIPATHWVTMDYASIRANPGDNVRSIQRATNSVTSSFSSGGLHLCYGTSLCRDCRAVWPGPQACGRVASYSEVMGSTFCLVLALGVADQCTPQLKLAARSTTTTNPAAALRPQSSVPEWLVQNSHPCCRSPATAAGCRAAPVCTSAYTAWQWL